MRLGEDFRLLVITGPNTGGKTAALKTAGLVTLMAQSGLPVPAEEAETPVFTDVLVDIGDEQSLQQNLSTFSSHMGRIARFLSSAGEDTLILLDELGAGTDPAEGAALGRAILDWLLDRGARAVVTTHLGALKTFAFTRSGVLNASVEFDVDTLSPTYRLVLGQAGASNALVIAERLGLPPEVVRRAKELVRPEDLESQEVLRSAQEIRSRAERHLRDADGMRRDTERLREAAEDAAREAEDRRRLSAREADDEMEATLLRLRRFFTGFAREMRGAPKPFGPRAEEFLAR
ncbi:MAG: endonuclease MutS2, partial [Planctomycetes bacterium]|nr:endonuclease MutS2 [Planctomycetota bacterium]